MPNGVIASGGAGPSYGGIYAIPSTLTIKGIYEHKYATVGGTMPNATWAPGSVCIIKGFTTSTSAAGITQTGESIVMPKLIYDCPGPNVYIGLDGSSNNH